MLILSELTSTKVDIIIPSMYNSGMKVYDTDIAIELIYQNRHTELDMFVWDCVEQYNEHAPEMGVPNLPASVDNNTEFWLPDYYRELDVAQYIRDLCPDNDQARARVESELELFTARNLLDILRLLIHIVTILRKNNVVWGVGRGSSVASYCLYLLGVHRVDSIKYELDIKEFLK